MPFPVIRNGSVFSGHAGANTTTFTISVPDHEDGDELYIVFVQDGNGATYTLAGWTNLFGSVDINATATTAVFHKTASSEPATYTLTSTVSERGAWATWAVANDGGINGTPAAQGFSGSTTITWPNYTLTVRGCLIFHIVVTEDAVTMTGGSARARMLGQFSTASGGSVGVWYETYEVTGDVSFGAVELSQSRAFGRIIFAVAPDDDDPSPAPSPETSTLQRLRTYPHP